MIKRIDVTDKVNFGEVDADLLPITKCICNRTFPPWNQVISNDEYKPHECPSCGRKFVFSNKIAVYELISI